MLNLELLVYNFHESLNLKPLFLHLARLIRESPQRADYVARLNRVAEEVTKKQMLVIEEGGATFDAAVDGKSLSLLGPDGQSHVPFLARDLSVDGIGRNFRLEVLGFDKANEQIQLRVTVRTAVPTGSETISTEFWLGHFDFPMIDNTRLPHDQRLAVVLNNFDAHARSRGPHRRLLPREICGPAREAVLRRGAREAPRRQQERRLRRRGSDAQALRIEDARRAW